MRYCLALVFLSFFSRSFYLSIPVLRSPTQNVSAKATQRQSEEKQKKKCARCATCMYKHAVPSIIVGYIGTSKRERECGKGRRKTSYAILMNSSFFFLMRSFLLSELHRRTEVINKVEICMHVAIVINETSCFRALIWNCQNTRGEKLDCQQKRTKKWQSIFIFHPLAVIVNISST